MESEDERFERLWTDYLEGDLDEPGIAALRRLLAADEARSQQVAELYQTHRLLGYLSRESDAASELFVRDLIDHLPKDGPGFTHEVLRKQQEMVSSGKVSGAKDQPGGLWKRKAAVAWMAAACVGLMAAVWLSKRAGQDRLPAVADAEPAGVQVTRLAHAKFFGELAPQILSTIPFDKEYTLISGMLELRFPQGAETILEAPAVFRVMEQDLLVMDMGTCSVHAPPGAEGFRVETPGSVIVDRGTRFSVKVSESNETEINVLEGMADVYPAESGKERLDPSKEIRLTEKQALRMQDYLQPVASPATFDSDAYRKQLPDRIISYNATRADDGYAESLTSVTVQRGGEEITYPVAELIGAEVTWFKAAEDHAADYLFSAPDAKIDHAALLADPSLITGMINPGGSLQPLKADPVMKRDVSAGVMGTPGMAIRFRQPVRNGPGPDVVFFELNSVIYPPEGDAFHVSPLQFSNGLRSHTIRRYDLNLYAPEALRVTQAHVHFSKTQVARSLDDLKSMKLLTRPTQLVYRAVAVGIDFSDLGYPPDALVDGLFLQDTTEDKHHVDPVFIGGLP